MNIVRNYIYGLVLIGLVFQSCLKDPNAEQFADLTDLFELNLIQTLGEERVIELELKLIDEKACDDVLINSSLIETSSDMILEISSIEIPSNCNDDLRTITKSHPITSDLGLYNFNLQLAGTDASTGRINIVSNQVNIDFSDLNSITEGELSIFKIQDGYLWGYFEINAPQEVQNSIKTALFVNTDGIQTFPSKTPGYYGEFKILEDNTIAIADAPQNATSFHADYSAAAWLDLEQKVNELLLNPEYQSLKIKITNELGEVIGNQ